MNIKNITFVVKNSSDDHPELIWVQDQKRHVFPIGFLRSGWQCKESQDLCNLFPELSNVEKLDLIIWAWRQIQPKDISIY